ncbi:MAG: TIGR00159 family protein [Elusimicrobia bacterium]|nr:TIGR00159 family protein [Elusimicrobiota bacterium]
MSNPSVLRTLLDILDILVVTFLTYRLVLLIRGTRAMQVAWGLVILFLLTALAQALKLKATTWLLHQFWLAGIVLLIVVFQSEIRAALAKLGSQSLGNILVTPKLEFIGEVIEAIKECSAKRIGALIVLEQEIGLKNFVETGAILHAEVSRELILSLLNPSSPLHDGALIIEHARLTAAACLLPLTQEQEVSKILGTRHRAAIGLTEISDALVLVVSEQTGGISLARGGKLHQDVDPEKMREELTALYRSKAEKSLLRKVAAGKT